MSLTMFPHELLLFLFSNFLDVEDVLNIRQTCCRFAQLSRDKTLWRAFLHRLEDLKIPLPSHSQPIEELSSRALEGIAVSACRVAHQWTRPREIQTVYQPATSETVTGMYLFLERWLLVIYQSGMVKLWDIGFEGQPCTTLQLAKHLMLWRSCAACVQDNRIILGLTNSPNSAETLSETVLYEIDLNTAEFILMRSFSSSSWAIRAIDAERQLLVLSSSSMHVLDIFSWSSGTTRSILLDSGDAEELYNAVLALKFFEGYFFVVRTHTFELHALDSSMQPLRFDLPHPLSERMVPSISTPSKLCVLAYDSRSLACYEVFLDLMIPSMDIVPIGEALSTPAPSADPTLPQSRSRWFVPAYDLGPQAMRVVWVERESARVSRRVRVYSFPPEKGWHDMNSAASVFLLPSYDLRGELQLELTWLHSINTHRGLDSLRAWRNQWTNCARESNGDDIFVKSRKIVFHDTSVVPTLPLSLSLPSQPYVDVGLEAENQDNMNRGTSPLFDVPEFPTLRRVKPLPKRRRMAVTETQPGSGNGDSYYPADDDGDDDASEQMQPGNTKKRKVPTAIQANEPPDNPNEQIAVASEPPVEPPPPSWNGLGIRKGKPPRITQAALQHKETLKARKRQLAAVLGALSLADTLALDQALSAHYPLLENVNVDPPRVRRSKRLAPRLARAARYSEKFRHPDKRPFMECEFTYSCPSLTAERLVATKEEVLMLRKRFEAELARQAAKTAKLNAPPRKSSRQKRSSAKNIATTTTTTPSYHAPPPPVIPKENADPASLMGIKPRNVKKKKRSALANASNPHHLRNYVPSRLPNSGVSNTSTATTGLWPLPLRFLSADLPRGRNKANNVPLEGESLTNPGDEWICAFCEYQLFYGDETAFRHAVKSRKKILRRRRRAQERAAAAASGTSTAKGAPEKVDEEYDVHPGYAPGVEDLPLPKQTNWAGESQFYLSAMSTPAMASGELLDLVSSSGSATIYPNDDAVLNVLHARFRADLPFTRIGATHLLVVNPLKTLANVNDASAHEYEERCYKDTSLPAIDSPKSLQPHVYELACRMYLLLRRRNESQFVITRGVTSSGKSSSMRLLSSQLLRLSTHSRKEAKLADQLRAMTTLLDSFGNAKTQTNPDASRHSKLLELHFNERGRFAGAKCLLFSLDKSRLTRLVHEERTYHAFYQLLAGATTAERDQFQLEDPSEYALLASSGTYRLPSGPFSDDTTAMSDLRAAFRTLSFKHTPAVFSLLSAILVSTNISFIPADNNTEAATVAPTGIQALQQTARLLGIPADDLEAALTNRTAYVRKELYTVLLNDEQASIQRTSLSRDLYAILVSFLLESANRRLEPPPGTNVISLLDTPGFASPPLSLGPASFEVFASNFADELVQGWISQALFADADDVVGNEACVEMLRGVPLNDPAVIPTKKSDKDARGVLNVLGRASMNLKAGKGADRDRDEELLAELIGRFSTHASFETAPLPPSAGGVGTGNLSTRPRAFGINHYAGHCSYDVRGFVNADADLLDPALVVLLRSSSVPFVAKLFAGPSLAAEPHARDPNTVVLAQVSSRPLRAPTLGGDEELRRLDSGKTYSAMVQLDNTLSAMLHGSTRTRLWTITCIRPNDSGSPNSFDKKRVRAQLRALLVPAMIQRVSGGDYVADFDAEEFCARYVPTMQGSIEERIEQCARSGGWREGEDYRVAGGRVWIEYGAWKGVEDVLRAQEKRGGDDQDERDAEEGTEYTHGQPHAYEASVENFADQYGGGGLQTPMSNPFAGGVPAAGGETGWVGSDYKGSPSGTIEGYPDSPMPSKDGHPNPPASGFVQKDALLANNEVEEIPSSRSRRVWLWVVWGTTWFVPTFLMKLLGRMKRPDIRLAWREKLAIFILIFLLNATVIFYIAIFGRLLCPDSGKVWGLNEVAEHSLTANYWVTIQGVVYDVTNFVQGDHSDTNSLQSNSQDVLQVLAGQDLTYYFPVPLVLGCPTLVTDPTMSLKNKNFSMTEPTAMHVSGQLQAIGGSKLHNNDWYTATFLPRMKHYRKGPLVYTSRTLKDQAADTNIAKVWGRYNNKIYDLTDYLNTITLNANNPDYVFLDQELVAVFRQQSGQDITKPLNAVLETMDPEKRGLNLQCLNNVFYIGDYDFRKTARCQVQNYFLIVASGILVASVGLKFLAALQLGGKRLPELQDKFVLCQVPCYTEGEDSLRKTIDSLAALNYDDKRKLIFIICDGNIIGSGNDRTTPRIVLDILGIDPKLDPEPLMFKSVGEGSKAINYGKVYSGLYEFEGHVVPYMVVVKVGKPTERSRPGNRGKRDSQILLMHYLNRVHFDAAMSPLELEIYHQMRNVIGIDPAFYEYIFTIDADTTVTPESLNRLVASAADDSSIIGICGETKLQNEEGSWWTMIQVYEYYISHHLSKAFESLFGSVTCLPGCFSLYRIRTADKGRPIIISNRIIDEYAEPNVDTLHKKNLFSLGEDRYLTTLMLKHFPTFKTKFNPHALAHTVAPESWKVLFSQRRRWINSTVHNLCELVFLPELFGFCCFSMRFFVFIDLLGTLILPATVVYLAYLIVEVALRRQAFPEIALIMIAVTYGLQAIIFIIKREFMLVGWMVVYILSYPVYSFFLPVYSFWCMDEFSWGNTRLVVGEGKEKKVIMNEDEKFDDSMIPLKKFSEYEMEAWETGSRHSEETGYSGKPRSRSRAPGSRGQSPHPYQQASQAGDYYRDTNLTSHNGSNPNLRLGSQPSLSNLSHQAPLQPVPQLPFMPFGGGPGSVTGSDYGGGMPMMGMPYQNTGSMYGMMGPMMGGMNMYSGSFNGSQGGFAPPVMPAAAPMTRPMSTLSMATTANMFSGPSQNPNPSDDELFNALRHYLSTQDLMTVTKKTAREAITAKFPNADLTSRKEFLNNSIDTILSES
ncbi:Glycosyltransferase family 2 protein [Mycena indigotica]|uniref:chitin synthase n=1 Tax=Mycena indigotica TaxID=2126181 RepID=A0A8H6WC62_9AGAR|nr:Glycosyltransferase family 2 protein [Mycena indigotica]KAF7309423.1 Glycosyltransferase family 2 protein [Mycena indigotica]